MFTRIETISSKTLAGMHLPMSFNNNRTAELWKNFIPRFRDIPVKVCDDLYSVEVYPAGFFKRFDADSAFQKWAGVEVPANAELQEGLEQLIIPSGEYAVFLHHGPAAEAARTYHYIYEKWFPNSGYIVDERPHFAVMGPKYKPASEGSEEEIFIPLRR
jgi:AraC family transcriptional regulator